MELVEEVKELLIETAKGLKGSARRLFMARTVRALGEGGKSRVPIKAADHDFQPDAAVTPVGIFLPASDELFLYGVTCHP
jgi:hypothetical protein